MWTRNLRLKWWKHAACALHINIMIDSRREIPVGPIWRRRHRYGWWCDYKKKTQNIQSNVSSFCGVYWNSPPPHLQEEHQRALWAIQIGRTQNLQLGLLLLWEKANSLNYKNHKIIKKANSKLLAYNPILFISSNDWHHINNEETVGGLWEFRKFRSTYGTFHHGFKPPPFRAPEPEVWFTQADAHFNCMESRNSRQCRLHMQWLSSIVQWLVAWKDLLLGLTARWLPVPYGSKITVIPTFLFIFLSILTWHNKKRNHRDNWKIKVGPIPLKVTDHAASTVT